MSTIPNPTIDSTAPLVIICKAPDVEPVDVPGALLIRAEDATYHGERVERLHAETQRVLALMTRKHALPEPGRTQMLGFIDLTLKFQDMGVCAIHWRYPETNLHPAHQVELGDVAIYLAKRSQQLQSINPT